MTTQDTRIEFLGAPGSPYTRKMLALLRYRRIPHNMLWGSVTRGENKSYPKPKVALMPTFFLPAADGKLEAVTDSTPLIRRFEESHQGRSAVPSDPALAFLNYLVEDYGDEWLTKAMFHYRWAYDADIENAGPLLTFWQNPAISDEDAQPIIDYVTKRQMERLYVVGSNEITKPVIEDSYKRFLRILDDLVARQGYVLGARPSSADFALYGQLTQLGIVDPTPAKILNSEATRLHAWIDRVDDLSGLEPEEGDWLDMDTAAQSLRPLLTEIGRVYAPFLLANGAAVMKGDDSFTTQIDGKEWTQPTFRYQAKCLMWIREAYAALDAGAKAEVDAALAGTGCKELLT